MPTPTTRTPLERAWNDFAGLLGARRIARRNGLAEPAQSSLTAAAETLLREFAAELPENRPVKAELPEEVPNPPENLDELRAAVDRVNSICADLTDEINKGDAMDASRTAELVTELRRVLEDQLGEVRQATTPPAENRPAPVEMVPDADVRAVTACAISAFAPPDRFPHADISEAAAHQRLYAAAVADRAEQAVRDLPKRYTGRGVPLR